MFIYQNMFMPIQNIDSIYWKRLQQGDSEALGILYDKYIDKLFLIALRTTDNRELAKDAVQEVFIDIWNYRDTLSDIHYSESYLTKVLKSLLLKKIKKENAAHHYQLQAAHISPEQDIESLIISRDTAVEKSAKLSEAIAKLSARQKQVLELHFDEGLSYELISKKLQINYQSVNNLLFRSILRLRNLMFGILWWVFLLGL